MGGGGSSLRALDEGGAKIALNFSRSAQKIRIML